MAFPNIITNEPVGTQMVSTIDDFERETRTWLKQCMQEISGYPDIATISVLGWTNDTRPTQVPNGKYLLGYNTQANSLELIGENGVSLNISKAFSLAAHPVGEYYWTSDANFNPNTAWGGTWIKIQDGTCLVSQNPNDSYFNTVGKTGGNKEITLKEKNLPAINISHTHGVGTYRVSGSLTANDKDTDSGILENITDADNINASGALYVSDKRNAWGYDLGEKTNGGYKTIGIDAKSGNGFTGKSAAATIAFGSGVAFNNMPPYRVAICWHRTA